MSPQLRAPTSEVYHEHGPRVAYQTFERTSRHLMWRMLSVFLFAFAFGAWLKRVVDGYYFRYHAVPGNLSMLSRFREWLCRYWRHILRRRSQRRKPDWEQLRPIFDRWIPRPRTLHPYPDVRFDARIQGRSRMR